MSHRLLDHTGTGIIQEDPYLGITAKVGTTVPTDNAIGYAPNCLFLKLDATGGQGVYINRGTKSACNFDLFTGGIDLSTLTATPAELNRLDDDNGVLAVTAGAGITGGAGTVIKTSVQKFGDLYITRIILDLTGLDSSGTAGDIIGLASGGAAYLGQITAARNGTIFGGTISCLEVPTTGDPDVDFFAASVATGAFDAAVSGLTGQSQLINTGDWTLETDTLTALPAANSYLYAVAGATDDNTYDAGKFLIQLYGY